MAAPMEAGAIAPRICKLLSRSNKQTYQHLFHVRQMSFINKLKFFQSKDEDKDVVTVDSKEIPEEPALQVRKRLSIEEKRSYKPPSNTSSIIQAAACDVFGETDLGEDWLKLPLENRAQKFNLLTRVMEELDHDVSSVDLNDMTKVGDVLSYFSCEVKDTSLLEDLTKLDLPKNLHMNLEYIRFHPDTDKIYDGVSAFPGRATKVTSIKYRRKYKGYDGGDPINYPEQFEGLA